MHRQSDTSDQTGPPNFASGTSPVQGSTIAISKIPVPQWSAIDDNGTDEGRRAARGLGAVEKPTKQAIDDVKNKVMYIVASEQKPLRNDVNWYTANDSQSSTPARLNLSSTPIAWPALKSSIPKTRTFSRKFCESEALEALEHRNLGSDKMASTDSLKVEKLFSVKGYVCLVTGGGTGIGLMGAQALAANGAKVYITGRRMEVLENAAKTHSPGEAGGEIIPVGPCDVTSKEDLEKLVKDISSKEKHINLLVANAGISGPKGIPEASDATKLSNDLWKSESPPEWADVFNTNVTAVYFTTVAFLPLLQASQDHPSHSLRSPSVIVISSMSGIMRNSQGHFAYNAAKGATVHLSKLMSSEFEKANIRINSIAPGYFPSEMTAKSSNEDNKSELPHEKVKEKGHVPAERPGSDEEMAMAMLFLCKNVYVNGQVIPVDGGVLNQVPGT
ncbi:MAG: hypothetical protein Q9218_003532 [Villophora microphyllina]